MHYQQTLVTTLQAVCAFPSCLCHKSSARVARPSLHMLVLQYIQRCVQPKGGFRGNPGAPPKSATDIPPIDFAIEIIL